MIGVWNKEGLYHKEMGQGNQDVVMHAENKRFCVITLADGVSECVKAEEGARTACEALTNLLFKKGEYFMDFEQEQIIEYTLSHTLHEIKKKAMAGTGNVEDYSSTLAGVFYDKKEKKLLSFSLGDSLILGIDGNRCRILEKPSDSTDGCCVTTTKNARCMAKSKILEAENIRGVYICSDGAWKRMLHKTRINAEADELLKNCNYEKLGEYLDSQKGYDDYSFIAMKIKGRQ